MRAGNDDNIRKDQKIKDNKKVKTERKGEKKNLDYGLFLLFS
jgi:hypothetical protein